jgi:hypothetical protein
MNKPSTPLLIHTNTNDDAVHIEEVNHFARELIAAGKKFDVRYSRKLPAVTASIALTRSGQSRHV